ncbi:MAG: mannitol dehydrogenase family protein, partial [Pseudomonadota bacterium]
MAAADQNTGATEQPAVATPQYDRAQLSAGIVHIGVGNFHRAHQAYYLDRLFNEDRDHDWAIVGAGLMPYDAAMRADLARQDWMSTVVELDPDGLSARRVGAMIDYAEVSAEGLIRALTRPEIRIASLTVTEGGYFVDATSGGLDFDHPAICAD